ncbi:hypothetical protein F0U44_03155 [Nocardioides humilatus]|uniref:Uncharacterized protein n=1 Tax=Nocardioides humilatus TaxID=2607660 RepID=A0A5B1LNG9_9ACTN|nr:hypothetical protein [Nocardioides humilatus]KAA1421320.1 hypothetical protein F0U44_03155 [Nocardioides humilatus]
MTDFDERLTAVLTAEADDAPHLAGLAAAARRRHSRRRRQRLALGATGAVLAVVASAAALTGGNEPAGDSMVADPGPSTIADDPWQTIEKDDVRVDVPPEWKKFSCTWDNGVGGEFEAYGEDKDDACHFRTALTFYASAIFDAITAPGEIAGQDDGSWGGYSTIGDYAVWVVTDDRGLTRQILASVRFEGEPQVRADRWVTGTVDGRTYEMPVGWGVGAGDDAGYSVEEYTPEFSRDTDGSETMDATHFRRYRDLIQVIAPTRAVAELVIRSVSPSR